VRFPARVPIFGISSGGGLESRDRILGVRFGEACLSTAGRMQVQNKRPHTASVLGAAERPRVTKLSPEAMIGPPPDEIPTYGPLVYELGSLVFTQKNGVRLPGGLPIF
jgi:hypothetical protein